MGAAVRNLFFHRPVAIGSPTARAIIIGAVPMPNAVMKPAALSAEPAS
jgi:hypothetical protein